jgi:hypothetical protein
MMLNENVHEASYDDYNVEQVYVRDEFDLSEEPEIEIRPLMVFLIETIIQLNFVIMVVVPPHFLLNLVE